MGPNSDVVPLCLTCPGRQWLGPFPVGLPRGLAAGLTTGGLRSCSNCCCCVEFAMQIDQDLIAALYVLGFNFLAAISSVEKLPRSMRYDYQAGASTRRGVEIRCRVAG